MGRCQVLIIDDDQRTREAMGEIAARAGYLVTVRASGDGLEELLASHEFTVAVIDYNLPQRSGLDIARSLRQYLPACRIVLISSEYRPQYLAQEGTTLVDYFLAKPFSKQVFLDTLMTLCPHSDPTLD